MKQVLVLCVWMLCLVGPAWAQQPESLSSLQRARVSLQNPPRDPKLSALPWMGSDRRKVGILTLIPAAHRGEIVRLSLPLGDLVTRAARSIGAANYRRAERRAREEVRRVMLEMEAQRRR